MMAIEMPVKTVMILEIACSICDERMRQDKKERDEYDNQYYHFRNSAKMKGWKYGATKEQHILTLCPQHASLATDMNLEA